ncbi:P-loop containing nucleoside triphosphate hydrolase protein [Entophlyctis helioformis]|nr:P-loop containing nucleoside triphosphate hydrolase protein [Entophlyctis helioformis]
MLITVNIVSPLLIPQLIVAIIDGPDSPGLVIKSTYAIAAIFFLLQLAEILVTSAETVINLNMTINVRAVLVDAIYRKALRLSPKARGEFSAGKINSLVDVDSAQIVSFPTTLTSSIGGSVQISLGIYFAAKILGVATWVAAGVFIGLLLFVLLLFPVFSAAMSGYMKSMDKRTKRLREFLYGIKIVKFQASEELFQKADKKAKKDKKDKKNKKGDKKDAEPEPTPESVVDADVKDASAEPKADGETAAVEETKQEPFKLEDINLSIPRGSLVAVVGSVGSGKSSFLSALIGGMRKTAGSSSVYGSVAYCAQEPWILTGTIEENIVFSDESVRPNIAKAVSASCLEHDLEILPNGLGTQIGEKGINLSGGQKARVALARAIARDADIYLLDDPIAALDAHVGKKVFDEAICGTLKSKTVVLVTHQLHLLPKVDFVVVLDNGRVAETGTFKDLMAVPESALSNIMKDYSFDDEDGKEDDKEVKEDDEIIKAIEEYKTEKAIEEDRRVGAVKFETIRSYFIYAGYVFLGLIIALFLIQVAVSCMVQIAIAIWIDDKWGWALNDYFKFYVGFGAAETTITLILVVVIGILDIVPRSRCMTLLSLVSSTLPWRSLTASPSAASSTA